MIRTSPTPRIPGHNIQPVNVTQTLMHGVNVQQINNHPHPEGFITKVKPHTDNIHQTLGPMPLTTLPITSLNIGQYKTVRYI